MQNADSMLSTKQNRPRDAITLHSVAPARGGKGARGGGGCPPPNVEKDGLRNSSKFDEKIGGWVVLQQIDLS